MSSWGGEKPVNDPMYDLRATLVSIANGCDEKNGVLRFILQDDAETAAIMLDVLEIRADTNPDFDVCEEVDRLDGSDGHLEPLLVVRYTYNTAAGMSREVVESIQASMQSLPRDTPMASIQMELPAIELLHEILKKNTKRLDESYLMRARQGTCKWIGWQMSVIKPVPKAQEKEEKAEQTCLECGKSNAKNVCSKCKVAKYCSRDCQRSHWKQHKATCTPPDAEGKEVATVNLGVGGMPEQLDHGYYMTVNNDTSRSSSMKVEKMSKKKGSSKKEKEGMFVVKVQVPLMDPAMRMHANPAAAMMGMALGGHQEDDSCCMCYDAKRKLNIQISKRNCPDAPKLAAAIRSRGVQGLKAYLNAYMTPENELKILFNEMLPMQSW